MARCHLLERGRLDAVSGYQATASTRQERAGRDVLPEHSLARRIDGFLADLAHANNPRNTIRAYPQAQARSGLVIGVTRMLPRPSRASSRPPG
jgi:hypothetical protein